MAEYRSLLEELAQNITAEDLEQLKSACKEDIPSGEGEAIATSQHWFAFLEKHSKLDKGQHPPLPPPQGPLLPRPLSPPPVPDPPPLHPHPLLFLILLPPPPPDPRFPHPTFHPDPR